MSFISKFFGFDLFVKVVQSIQPEFVVTDDDQVVIAFPGDPLHPSGAVQSTDRHRISAERKREFLIMTLENKVTSKDTGGSKL